ncbi:UNVERIFIED_CONTAM: hypothetical protein Sindi_2546200 [Sesamum indicum]
MFRFDNYLARSPEFIPSVQNIWQHNIIGTPMYAVTRKLKALKPIFREQRRKKGDLSHNVQMAKGFLEAAQILVSSRRRDELYIQLEHSCRLVLAKATKLEQIMLQQRAKMQWMKGGDQCSRVFFRKIIIDCRPLLLKIDKRIAGWEGTTISYAGRVQIIKSVLISLSLYWASAFILPKKVINEIEKRLRTFLWKGTTNSGYAKVAWKDICRPKEEGGLGFKDINTLNHALTTKKLCDVIRCDRTSIWVEWLYQGRLQHTSIWTIRDHGGSWGWRKILRLRMFLRTMVDYRIGDGRNFFLWQDPWHHLGPLCDTFPRGSRLLGLDESSRLSTVIHEGVWQWPLITDIECLEITHALPTIFGREDRIIWRFENDRPTTQAIYELFDPPGPKVGWSSLLSGSLKIPRHKFILWLAIQGKLATTDKPWLAHLGPCVLCNEGLTETHAHLFFQCRFSRRCLMEIRRTIRFLWPNREWKDDITWASQRWRGKHIINMSYRALLAACVYHIWKERNLRRFDHTERTPTTIALLIIEDIRQRIHSISLSRSVSTRALFRLWRIPWPVEG